MKCNDGIPATRELLMANPTACVLMVSGYDDAEMRSAAASAGACGYVLKENLLDLRRLLQTSIANQLSTANADLQSIWENKLPTYSSFQMDVIYLI